MHRILNGAFAKCTFQHGAAAALKNWPNIDNFELPYYLSRNLLNDMKCIVVGRAVCGLICISREYE